MRENTEDKENIDSESSSELESNRWIISYADFITLLFALFVVLYAMSSINKQKYETVIDSISKALKTQPSIMRPIISSEENNIINMSTKKQPDSNATNTEFILLKKNIHEAFDGFFPENLVSVRDDRDWVEIELKNSVLFDPGSAQLIQASAPILKKIALILLSIPNIIQVEGFTDDVPVQNQLYPSNWELSAARSAAIVRRLEEFGIQSERMSAVGYGKNYPIADNKLDNGPSQNRRVKLLILKYATRSRLETEKFISPTLPIKQVTTTDPLYIHPVELENGDIRYTNIKERKASSFDLKP